MNKQKDRWTHGEMDTLKDITNIQKYKWTNIQINKCTHRRIEDRERQAERERRAVERIDRQSDSLLRYNGIVQIGLCSASAYYNIDEP